MSLYHWVIVILFIQQMFFAFIWSKKGWLQMAFKMWFFISAVFLFVIIFNPLTSLSR